MFDLLRGPHITLLGFGGSWQGVIEACVARFPEAVKGFVIVGEAGDPSHFVDEDGSARAAYGEAALFVIRPDSYIGMATAERNPTAIIGYLARIATSPATPR
jgi:hypothetical protein